ncbi:MAG: iron dicitrate transport regulator FecR [Blastopirellula sp.]|nr:MAG: iron dicitrate transport regulator FecR [Blastopirellula sp.]
MNKNHLDELIGLLLDDSIDETQINELVAIISDDSAALQQLREQLILSDRLSQYEDDLRSEASFLAAIETRLVASESGSQFISNVIRSAELPKSNQPDSKTSNWLLLVTSVAAGALAASLFLMVFFKPSVPPANTTVTQLEEPTDDGVAVLTKAVDAVWNDENSPAVGVPISPQDIRLSSGLVQLEFYNGANVIIEGPAHLELIDSETVICHFGKVRARVPQHAQGFTILSPGVELVDLGTEFGMEVSQDGNTSVHVFEGKVELYDLDSDRDMNSRRELLAGDAVEVAMAGETRSIEVEESTFVSVVKLDEMELKSQQERFLRWKELSVKIANDERAIAYYSFQTESTTSRVLENQTAENSNHLDGTIVGSSWAEGRWPGKQSLEFKRPSDRVRVHIPGEFKSLTFAAWVRVDGLDRKFNTLMLTDEFDPGEPHWQINREGQLILGVNHPDQKAHDYKSPTIINLQNLGQWIFLATVFDADNSTVSHFLNGKMISEEALMGSTMLKIGNAEIGNWGVPISKTRAAIRNFNGRIDEMMIFDAAIADREIRSMYRIGRSR